MDPISREGVATDWFSRQGDGASVSPGRAHAPDEPRFLVEENRSIPVVRALATQRPGLIPDLPQDTGPESKPFAHHPWSADTIRTRWAGSNSHPAEEGLTL